MFVVTEHTQLYIFKSLNSDIKFLILANSESGARIKFGDYLFAHRHLQLDANDFGCWIAGQPDNEIFTFPL